jgi:hypothetical protein
LYWSTLRSPHDHHVSQAPIIYTMFTITPTQEQGTMKPTAVD